MKLIDYAVRRRITVYVLVLMCVFMGAYSYVNLPREAAPDIPIPYIIVSTPYIGASPQDVENLVTRYIEKKLQGLENVKELRSTSMEGLSSINIEFNPSVDIDEALQKVKDKVDLAKPDLPGDVEDPIVNEVNLSNVPIMIVNLAGEYSLVKLKEVADDLADEIETVRGVLEVQVAGGVEREVQVDVDPDRLMLYNLSIQDVVDAVRRENVILPGGSVEIGTYKYSVRIPGEIKDMAQLEGLIIKAADNKAVYIRDVATVTYGFEERSSYARLNGQSCVSLSIIKRSGENLIAISDEVKAIIDERAPRFPTGTQVTALADQSEDIRNMVKDLENNIISGLLLVVAVLFLFMGVRNAFFVGLAIPLSMLVSFTILSALDITLNMVVLFSLILALGMLVDNGIVIVENIYRHRQEGKNKEDGARAGAGEVAVAVIASTLTTLCAFGPMLFWPGLIGEFMSYLPLTLIITLSSSLLVALVMNPAFCASFMQVKGNQEETSPFLLKVLARYQRQLERALDRPWKTFFMGIGALAGVVVIYGFFGHGIEFFPKVDPGKAYIEVRAPSGTSLGESNRIVHQVEQALSGVPYLETYVANVGTSGPHVSRVTVDFVDEVNRPLSGFAVIDNIRAALTEITGAEIEITQEETGPATGAPISIEISGDNFEVLGELAGQIKRRAGGVAGVVDLQDNYDKGRPEARVRIDREVAALAGLNTSLIASTVRAAVYGTKATEYRVGEDEYDIRVRLKPDRRQNLNDLERIIIKKDERLIPLSTIAHIEVGGGMGNIQRKDMKRVITVEGKVAGRNTAEALGAVQQALADLSLPAGYHIHYGGENEDQAAATAFLSKAFIIAVFLIGLVLITQFDSVTMPLVIISSVALSLIGVLVGLLVTGTPFGVMMTGIGVISLAGVVVNNAIVLIDYTLQLRARGFSPREALVQAGVTRFRPVILTAITTILGLIPLGTGISFDFFSMAWELGGRSSQWWGPMAIAVIFGLAFATILTLVMVPVMISLIWKISDRHNNEGDLPVATLARSNNEEPVAIPTPVL